MGIKRMVQRSVRETTLGFPSSLCLCEMNFLFSLLLDHWEVFLWGQGGIGAGGEASKDMQSRHFENEDRSGLGFPIKDPDSHVD